MNARLCVVDDHGTDAEGNPEQRNAAHGLHLCRRCVRWLERDISELPSLYDDLELRLHPSSTTLHPYTTRDAAAMVRASEVEEIMQRMAVLRVTA